MKRILLSIILLLNASSIYSQEIIDNVVAAENKAMMDTEIPYSAVSFYKPSYFIFGNMDDQAKVQLSFKYEILKESGLFYGYTQTMFWMIYENSGPFNEINFNPEFFWNYGNQINYIQLGFYEHKSNGKDGPASRGFDSSYLQAQFSHGDNLNAGINFKGFYIWSKADENKDITDYLGYYEAKIFIRFIKSSMLSKTDREEIYIRGGTGGGNYGFDYKKGWVEAGLKFRVLFRSVQPQLFIQGFYGYGESLIEYNYKDHAVRAGIIF